MTSSPRRPAPPPLEANDQVVAAVISAGWAIALITLLAARPTIPASDRWWIWTCVTGLGLGLFGMVYVPYLKRARARAASRRESASQASPGAGPDGTGPDGTGPDS
jgi:H+/Cl- antiporter ClcA